jgi:hypothetical protein
MTNTAPTITLSTAGTVKVQEVPQEILRLAERLGLIHGQPQIVKETGGIHIRIASPEALEKDGSRELEGRHLYVNADKFFAMGKFRGARGTYDADRCAMCMKYETPYSLNDLLRMPPLSQRGYKDVPTDVQIMVKERYLIDDGRGNMIPEHPGLVTPINMLPEDHVAVQYLRARNYDLDVLDKQFGCAYCYSQTPERWIARNDPANLSYKPLPGGFKDTPQGRLIFYAYVDGVQVAWQARVIDKMEGPLHYYWHPYENRWDLVEIQVGYDAKKKKPIMTLCPPFNTVEPFTWQNPRWEISKYKTARGAARNELIFGLDAAVEWNRMVGRADNPIAVGGEGPLDAGRPGPPGVAMVGKFLSDHQVALITSRFKEFIWCGDNDEAGRKASLRVRAELAPKLKFHEVQIPKGKDLGDLDQGETWKLLAPLLIG